jgi:hypothetical protein
MGKESTPAAKDMLARLIDDAATKAAEASEAAAKASRFKSAMAEIERATQLAAEFGLTLNVVESQPAVMPAPISAAPQSPPSEILKVPPQSGFDGTVGNLIACYRNHKTFADLRFRTRRYYEGLLRRIELDIGNEKIADIDEARALRAYEQWSANGRVAIGHSRVTMLRMLAGFGAKHLKDRRCRELKFTLSGMKFPVAKARREKLTAEHANAIRAMAHEMGFHSMALAQSFQFDLLLQQKDVIGEWVPHDEDGVSEIIKGDKKWLRGIRWDEIKSEPNGSLVLEHITSHSGKPLRIDLSDAKMVLEELKLIGERPTSKKPMVIYEKRGIPWDDDDYRRIWRKVADAAGVPPHIRNMDSRTPARDRNLLNRREIEVALRERKPAK